MQPRRDAARSAAAREKGRRGPAKDEPTILCRADDSGENPLGAGPPIRPVPTRHRAVDDGRPEGLFGAPVGGVINDRCFGRANVVDVEQFGSSVLLLAAERAVPSAVVPPVRLAHVAQLHGGQVVLDAVLERAATSSAAGEVPGRGRGVESEGVAVERGRLDALIAGLLFMAGMRRPRPIRAPSSP